MTRRPTLFRNPARLSYTAAIIAAGVLGSSLASAGSAGSAAAASDPPSVRVRYGDLDLASEADVAQLYKRIAAAARTVCPSPNTRDLLILTASKACRTQAISQAVHQVGSPRLAALAATRSTAG